MSDDVVDIRKRIEEMRNEVSAAIVSGREQAQAARALGELADIAICSHQQKLKKQDPATPDLWIQLRPISPRFQEAYGVGWSFDHARMIARPNTPAQRGFRLMLLFTKMWHNI